MGTTDMPVRRFGSSPSRSCPRIELRSSLTGKEETAQRLNPPVPEPRWRESREASRRLAATAMMRNTATASRLMTAAERLGWRWGAREVSSERVVAAAWVWTPSNRRR